MSYSDINFSTKKVLGYANTSLDSTITYDPDPTKNIPSFQKISINQIYGQSIPASVDYVVKNNSDFGKPSLPGLTFNGYINALGKLITSINNPPTGAYGCLYTLNDSPHIQYVQSLPITNRLNKSSTPGPGSRTIFNIIIKNTNTNIISTNYFTNIIPFSYGPGYGYSLTQGYQIDSSKVMDASKQCIAYRNSTNNIVNPNDYVVDTDAGLLYIKNDDWNLNFSPNPTDYNASNGFPTLSFFRYAGKMGIDGLPSGTDSSAGILMNAPPAPMSVTGTVDPLNAYIYFTYPDQFNSGIGLLPVIDSFYVNVKGSKDTTDTTVITIPNTKAKYSVTGTNYVSITDAAGPTGSLFITTDRIINTTGTYGILESVRTTPTEAGIIQCINFSKTNKTGILGTMPVSPFLNYYSVRYEDRNSADVYLWYGNKNRKPNVASCSFKYLEGGDPSKPTITSVLPINHNSLSIDWKGSDKFDATEETSSVPVGGFLQYTVSYGPTGTNNYRYGGIASANTVMASTGTISYTTYIRHTLGGTENTVISSSNFTPVFPDTYFFAEIKALNSSNLYGIGAFAKATTTIATTGPPLLYTQPNNTISVIGTTSLNTAKSVANNAVVSNLLKSNTDGYKFSRLVNIHNSYTERGSTATNLVTFNATLNSINGPSSYGLNGFEYVASNYSPTSLNGITISANTSVTDQYGNTQGCDKYYLQNLMTVSTDKTNIISSPSLYTLSLNGLYSPNNSGVNCTFNSSFYYDGESVTPTIGSVKIKISDTLSFTQVCGIYIVNIPDTNSITFEVETKDVKNLGKNFYNSSWVLEYSSPSAGFTIDSTNLRETTLSSLDGNFGDSNNFNNKSFSTRFVNSYFRDIFTLKVQAQNVQGDKSTLVTSPNDLTIFKYIFDKQALQNSKILSRSNIPGPGFRIYSGVNPGTYENSPRPGTPVFDLPFNHTKNLSTDYSSELLYANGMYVTPNSSNETNNYYLKYSDYYAGQNITQPDYSSPSIQRNGYRYATFVWTIPNTTTYLQSETPLSTLKFSINDVNGISASNDGIAYATSNNENIQLYYCIVDSGSTDIRSVQGDAITTYWINANSLEGTIITTNNNYVGSLPTDTNYVGSDTPNVRPSGSSLIFNVKNGGSPISVVNFAFGPVHIYLRIGLPMSAPVSFTSVSCDLTE